MMNSFDFEKRNNELRQLSSKKFFGKSTLNSYVEFYRDLFNSNDSAIIEIYLLETKDYFVKCFEAFTAFGNRPSFTNGILEISNNLLQHLENGGTKQRIESKIVSLKSELELLHQILEGKTKAVNSNSALWFPVIEKSVNSEKYGLIESISISIHKNKKTSKNQFHLIPSLPQIENKLELQIANSWSFAQSYLKKYYSGKIPPLEITIIFVRKLGIYEGDSLGVALTCGFIEELFNYFDLRSRINISQDIISTGSVNNLGEIKEVSENIIIIKSLAAFYSTSQKFIIPFDDYHFAKKVIDAELLDYPNRKLEIVPVNNIGDVINRRDTVEIRKQNIAKWGIRKLLRNKISVSLFVILIMLIFGFYYTSLNDTPHYIEFATNNIFVKNKYGKILWEKETVRKLADFNKGYLEYYYKIIDIDKEQKGVLVSDDLTRSLKLFDKNGDILWNYKFNYQNLKTKDEEFVNNFGDVKIIDTQIVNGKEILFVIISHSPYYPTAIAMIDVLTGKQYGDLFWHSGGIIHCRILDIDDDGKIEIVGTAINNGLGRAVIFSLEINNIKGQSISTEKYTFQDIPRAEFDEYILLPTPDFFHHQFSKYYKPSGLSINFAKKYIHTGIIKHNLTRSSTSIGVRFSMNFNLLEIIVSDTYANERDKFVKNGIMDYPLSDTDEYRQLLMNQIEYWDGGRFVKYADLSNENN